MDDDLMAFLQEAFPEKDWTDLQVEAMKSFIKACTEEGYEEDDEMPMMKKGPGKGEDALAIVLGPGPGEK